MRYLNDLSYRGTNPLFYPHFPVSPKVKIQVLIIRYLQAYSQKVTKSGEILLSCAITLAETKNLTTINNKCPFILINILIKHAGKFTVL